MIKREAKLQIRFKHWLQAHPPTVSTVYELKQTGKRDSFYDKDIETHQLNALVAAKHGRQYYKIPDDSMGAKPYDCYVMVGAEAYIVIGFASGVVMVDIDKYLALETYPLTYPHALKIGIAIM